MAASKRREASKQRCDGAPHPLDFFGHLVWIDGRPLLDTIEPYRRQILTDVLVDVRSSTAAPRYNLALNGRAKKNWKTSDLILAGALSLPRVAEPTRETMLSSSRMTKARPATTWRSARN